MSTAVQPGTGMPQPAKPASQHLRAEFDQLADWYRELHKANIAITGEGPEFFAEYKIADLARLVQRLGSPVHDILDFGSGIGNSIPWFRKYFPRARLSCADVSPRSIELARERLPGPECHVLVDACVPLAAASQDVVFSACVFHHIPHVEHLHWLGELRRLVRPGGLLVIYEHNPANPLTVHAVRTCPLDVNAHLVRPAELRCRAAQAGWRLGRVDYKVFFPRALSLLRPLEARLEWLPLGAQYRLIAHQAL